MSKRRLPLQPRSTGRGGGLGNPRGGVLLPSHKLQCYSVACLDMPQLEFGDKAVLPPKILLELQRLKIPTPLLFSVRAGNTGADEDTSTCSQQYCSVQEFSAPEGQVYLPYWLMQSLHIPEGGSAVLTSVVNLPRGIYCRLQPESLGFLDLAADIGPKLLMETALRRYSVLSVNSTIVIEYGSVRYYVRVAELKPANVVSLCGDVDLEMDFMPPEGSDPKRPTTGKTSIFSEKPCTKPPTADTSAAVVEAVTNDSPATAYGRRLRDGGYVESPPSRNEPSTNVKTSSKCSFQKAQQLVRDKQSRPVSMDAIAATVDSPVLSAQLRLAQGAFTTPGYTLGKAVEPQSSKCPAPPSFSTTNQGFNASTVDSVTRQDGAASNTLTCEMCLANVSSINVELHTLRCIKNPAYHKFECSTCHEKILSVSKSYHQHCPDCTILCDSVGEVATHQRQEHFASDKCEFCGVLFTRTALRDHVDNECDHVLVPCSLCGLAFKKKDSAHHFRMCSSRTERCDTCKAYIGITEFDAHQLQCEVSRTRQEPAAVCPVVCPTVTSQHSPLRTKATGKTGVECAYCLQEGFPSVAAVEQHVLHHCCVAKSFTVPKQLPATNSNQENFDQSPVEPAEKQDVAFARPLLAQGRIRRKGDVSALRSTPSPRNLSTNQVNHLPTPTRTTPLSLGTSRVLPPASQDGKHRKIKSKPRVQPQLRALPHRKPVASPNGPRASTIDRCGPGELCISSVGGTSHRALAPAPRSRTSSRTRRRPSGSLPRLDKL